MIGADLLGALSVLVVQDPLIGQAPMREPVRLLAERPGGGDWVSDLATVDGGTFTTWTWAIGPTSSGGQSIDAFQNRYDCATGTFVRLRQERYDDGALTRVGEGPAPARAPTDFEMEARVLERVCSGRGADLSLEPSVDRAAARARTSR